MRTLRKRDNREREIPDRQVLADCIRKGKNWIRYLTVSAFPERTAEKGLLGPLSALPGVTLNLRIRAVGQTERASLLRDAERRARFGQSREGAENRVRGDGDMAEIEEMLREGQEDLCGVRLVLKLEAPDRKSLETLSRQVRDLAERSGIVLDGMLCAQRAGERFFSGQGRVSRADVPEFFLPRLSAANLYPAPPSGRTDPEGLPLGRTRAGNAASGAPVLCDLRRLDRYVTNGNVLILGNSGEGKSHLLKLLLCHLTLQGRRVLALDAEGEYGPLCRFLGGGVVDLMGGGCRINPFDVRLRPGEAEGEGETLLLSRHIAFLKEFFRISRRLDGPDLDALEILVWALYRSFGYTETSRGERVPVMADLDALIRRAAQERTGLIAPDTLRRLSLSLSPLVRGSQAAAFNGRTDLKDSAFTVFDLRGLTDLDADFRNALLFNVLSYLDHALLGQGRTAASVDELYLFLGIPSALETLRNACKRVRKRESLLLLSSQNPEDFLLPGIREMARPLFSIPSHRFLFHTGVSDERAYRELLGLSAAQWAAISRPDRGHCLYVCGRDSLELDVSPLPAALREAGV